MDGVAQRIDGALVAECVSQKEPEAGGGAAGAHAPTSNVGAHILGESNGAFPAEPEPVEIEHVESVPAIFHIVPVGLEPTYFCM